MENERDKISMIITTFDKLNAEDRALVRIAVEARENAYTPYSGHKVGASVRTSKGNIYPGCNVEIISLQTSCHAERNAVMNMAMHGERVIETLVCYGPYSGVPCAECRQVIWEFCDNNPDVRIIGATTEGEIELMTIGEIYPYAYGPATKGIDCKEY